MTRSLTCVKETKEEVKPFVGENTTPLHIFRLQVEANFLKAVLD